MVLEMLVTSRSATLGSWWKLLGIGAIYATLGMFIAAWVFPQYASMVMVFLTVLGMAYLMHEVILKEEEYDEELEHKPYDIFVHHGQTLIIFLILFLGMLIAYTFWYAVLPFSSTAEQGVLAHLDIRTVFEAQNDTVQRITGRLFTGAVVGLEEGMEWFMTILVNNLGVLFFSFLFGFFYGYGAIYVLTWNASVIAAAAGSNFKQALAGGLAWYDKILAFFSSWLAYMPHGLLEILGYFVAALAAGILGAGISRKVWRDQEKFNRVLADFVFFSALSVIIIVVAAFIEVWVTPALI